MDALTEGEGGFEEALLEAIGRDEALLDPSELFKTSDAQGEIDSEDAAYWNVELTEPETERASLLSDDSLVQEGIRLGGMVAEIDTEQPRRKVVDDLVADHEPHRFAQAVFSYLDSVQIIADEQKLSVLLAELIDLLQENPARLCDWLRDNRVVFPGCEGEVAAQIVHLAQQTRHGGTANSIQFRPVVVSPRSSKPPASKSRKRQPDLLAVPDEVEDIQPKRQQHERLDETAPLQLALF